MLDKSFDVVLESSLDGVDFALDAVVELDRRDIRSETLVLRFPAGLGIDEEALFLPAMR